MKLLVLLAALLLAGCQKATPRTVNGCRQLFEYDTTELVDVVDEERRIGPYFWVCRVRSRGRAWSGRGTWGRMLWTAAP